MIKLLNIFKTQLSDIETFGIVHQLQNGQLYLESSKGEKREFNINDSLGNVLYLRDLQSSTFEQQTDKSCNGSIYLERKSMKLVFYTFDMYHDVYCKYVNEILLILSNYPDVTLQSKNSNFEAVYQREQGKAFDGGTIPYITEINFTLSNDF